MGIDYIKKDIFQTFNIATRQSHEFLYNNSSLHQLHNDPNWKETCGRLCVINTEKLTEIEQILQEKNIKTRTMV